MRFLGTAIASKTSSSDADAALPLTLAPLPWPETSFELAIDVGRAKTASDDRFDALLGPPMVPTVPKVLAAATTGFAASPFSARNAAVGLPDSSTAVWPLMLMPDTDAGDLTPLERSADVISWDPV